MPSQMQKCSTVFLRKKNSSDVPMMFRISNKKILYPRIDTNLHELFSFVRLRRIRVIRGLNSIFAPQRIA